MPNNNSPTVQAELAKFKAEHDALITKHATQESVLLGLLSKTPPLTPSDNTKISETKLTLTNISQEIAALTARESQYAASIDSDSISSAAQRQALIKSLIVTTPNPKPGELAVIHPAVNSAALLDYMTFTQHLNPYGRKRQCDRDLENLLSIIANDLGEKFGDYTKAVSAIKKTTS